MGLGSIRRPYGIHYEEQYDWWARDHCFTAWRSRPLSKEARDRELKRLVKGKTNGSFRSGLLSDNEEAVMEYVPVWQTCRENQRSDFHCDTVYTAKPRPMGKAIKAWCTNQRYAAPSSVDGLKAVHIPLPCDYRNWFDNCGWVALSSKSSVCWGFDFYHAIGAQVQLKTKSTALYLVISARQAWRIQLLEIFLSCSMRFMQPNIPQFLFNAPSRKHQEIL